MFAKLRTACLAGLVAAAVALPAQADDGLWKVGNGYVIRFEQLDLSQPADRQVLLAQVERAAAKLCEGQRPLSRRRACAEDAAAKSAKALSPTLRASLDIARFERDGQQQAQR
ncbi:MAG: UrcA family protein [Hyphomonadaceae bacterium]